jgi:drug/metabolite transporter (DMT)-like permease
MAQFRGGAIPIIHSPARRFQMNAARITGIVLIVLGLAGFFTGGFSFTKDTTAAKLGPIQLTVKEKESVNIPQWLSLGAIVLGAVVLVVGFKKN